jgi:molybdate transport system permease protein
LTFAFHRRLDGFSLDIAHSTTARRIALLGASGSGKSLTLRALAGLDRAPGDRLLRHGHDISAEPPERRGIAYVPQSYGLFPHLTAERQLRFAVDGDPARARFWFARLGLGGLEQRLPQALSLGQQQRVAIARAFSRNASLLLLDEPFAALDTPLRAQLRAELRRLQDEIEATTILVTHDPQEAFALADELIVLQAGKVLQAGPVNDIFARPASAQVARILGAETIAAGLALAGNRIDIGGGIAIAVAGPPLRPGARLGWSVSPSALGIVSAGGYPGLIIAAEAPVAGRQALRVRLGDAVLRVAADADAALRLGPARIAVPPSAVQVWPAEARPAEARPGEAPMAEAPMAEARDAALAPGLP